MGLDTFSQVCIATTTVGVGTMVWSSRAGVRWTEFIAKPLASAAFVALAIGQGAREHPVGQTMFWALVLCAIGDVLLIPKDRRAFTAGLFAFLLGHVGFAVAFVQRGIDPTSAALGGLAVAAVAVPILRWLMPHVRASEPAMVVPVLAYVAVIATMVALAVGTTFSTPSPDLAWLGAAAAFFLSDLSVARDRFVSAEWTNRLWGLPLYFGSTLAFALLSAPP